MPNSAIQLVSNQVHKQVDQRVFLRTTAIATTIDNVAGKPSSDTPTVTAPIINEPNTVVLQVALRMFCEFPIIFSLGHQNVFQESSCALFHEIHEWEQENPIKSQVPACRRFQQRSAHR